MVQAASTRLNKQAEYVNSLNVFPSRWRYWDKYERMHCENGAKEVADKPASTWRSLASILERAFDGCAWELRSVITSQLPWIFPQAKGYKDVNMSRYLALAFQRCGSCA